MPLAGDTMAPMREMVSLPGGVFRMGCDHFYPEERPERRIRLSAFRIDKYQVTNRDFAHFVEATGYRTIAETAPDPADYPGLRPEMARAGSLVFEPTRGPVPLGDPPRWWSFCAGADWRHPHRPGQRDRRFDGSSRGPYRPCRCPSLCALGGQKPAHGSGVGVCRARRA